MTKWYRKILLVISSLVVGLALGYLVTNIASLIHRADITDKAVNFIQDRQAASLHNCKVIKISDIEAIFPFVGDYSWRAYVHIKCNNNTYPTYQGEVIYYGNNLWSTWITSR